MDYEIIDYVLFLLEEDDLEAAVLVTLNDVELDLVEEYLMFKTSAIPVDHNLWEISGKLIFTESIQPDMIDEAVFDFLPFLVEPLIPVMSYGYFNGSN